MKQNSDNPKSLTMYAVLQTATLLFCWAWFIGLWWAPTFFGYSPADFEWWLLVAAGLAGVYGLRPNLVKAIDTAWLRGVTNTKALAERAAQLKPIKRRIDLIFSLATLALLLVVGLLWATGILNIGSGGTNS